MSSAEITLKEVYDILVEVRTDVTSIKADLKNTSEDVQDHEARLRVVEKWIWGAAGAGAVGGAGLSQIISLIAQ